ncbi:MAG: hypothetical protein EZS28_000270 [Streblomastix strix]|uniref:Uncharacterized protein n=1 Tax=Streblomastix strix TaxID=222440 RepID=A0A5J4XAB8_9EUKA|nr:MAG: hypothetical protein EZS28_000270 [Streblomastix strix]
MSVPSTNLPPVVPRATSPHRTSPILSKSTVLYSQIPNLGNRTLQTTINTSQTYSTPKKNSSLSNFNVVSASSEKRERSPFHANITASSFSPQKPDELTRGSTNDEMIVNRPELVHYPQELQQRMMDKDIKSEDTTTVALLQLLHLGHKLRQKLS